MRLSRFFQLIAFLLVASLFISFFALPSWYVYDETWKYTTLGSTIVLSLISILLFLSVIGLDYILCEFYLSFNEWIEEVEDMSPWFNPSFLVWAFAKDRKRWAKHSTSGGLILAITLGVFIFWFVFLEHLTQESFILGTLLSIAVVGSFSLIFYKSFTSRIEIL